MTSPKRHLRLTGTRAACGLRDPSRWTTNPRDVTCGGCRKTLAMADAEVLIVTKQQKK